MASHASGLGRLVRSLTIAILLATPLLGTAGAIPARAAEDALSLVSSASYRLDPAKGLVRVTVDVTAKNNKPDLVRETPNGTITTSYFYESARIAIHAEARSIRASAGGKRLSTRLRQDEGFAVLDVLFRSDLLFGQSTKFRVQYELPGGAPRSESDIRVGSAFATFYAWAFGDRGDVRIAVPAGFEVETTGSTVSTSVEDGATTLTAGDITNVNEWYVVVVADRHDALTEERLDLPDGEGLVVRGWPEDTEWQQRVGDLLRDGLPVLADKIGLDWPVDGDIEVAEVHTPLLEGYAGVFYPDEERIEISEELDELTIIHEASHAWFNGALFTGRWINEGLADEYASRVLEEISDGGFDPIALGPGTPGVVKLNEWTHPGRIDDEETKDRETFGYEASWTLIRDLIDEIGEDGMREVLAAANDREIAYVGASEPERVSSPNDWRRFLDLLEERGGSKRADSVFQRWIVTDDEQPLLEDRRVARRAYAALVEAGTGWLPGYVIREPLDRWDFARATREIATATAILGTRNEIARTAAAAGITPSGELRAAYEGAERDLEAVRQLATDELAAVTELEGAVARVGGERGLLTTIGLIGEDPAGALAAATSAYAAGDLEATTSGAAAVNGVFDRALDAGRTRAIGGITALGVGGVGIGAAVLLRRRRRREQVAATNGGSLTANASEAPPADTAAAAMIPPAASGDIPQTPQPASTMALPEPVDGAAEPEPPAPRRRRRSRKSEPDVEPTPPVSGPDAAAASGDIPQTPQPAPTTALPEPVDGAAEPEPPAPRRRRRSRKSEPGLEPTPPPSGPDAPIATESPAEPYATLGGPATTASAAAEPAEPGRAEGDES